MKKKLKIWKKNLKFFFWKNFLDFFSISKSPASGKENVRFPDSPDFENLLDFQTGRDIQLSPSGLLTWP